MAQIRKVKYCHLTVPSRSGQAVKILSELNDAGINLLAFSGFPTGPGRSQIDLVAENMGAVTRLAKRLGWRASQVKRAFLATGQDEPGAVAKVLSRLARQNINVTAADAVAAGKGRFGMIFWVKPDRYTAAARALRAR
jgi:hypothetical protein